MISVDEQKYAVLLPPQIKDNGDFASNAYVDTKDWAHLRVLFACGVVDSTIGSTAEGTAPLVEECDTTDGTYTDVTSADLADSIAATEDGLLFAIDVDLTKTHKRYMQVQAPHSGDGTTGSNLCIIGILSRKSGGTHPGTATALGVTEHIQA